MTQPCPICWNDMEFLPRCSFRTPRGGEYFEGEVVREQNEAAGEYNVCLMHHCSACNKFFGVEQTYWIRPKPKESVVFEKKEGDDA